MTPVAKYFALAKFDEGPRRKIKRIGVNVVVLSREITLIKTR